YGFGKLNPETWQYECLSNQYQVYSPQDDYGLRSQEYLTYDVPLPHDYRAYFHDVIQLLKNNGYVPGVNIFGFPYDWRQIFAESSFQSRLLNRIKEAYEKSGRRKIDVITHSLGGVVFQIFCIMNPEALNQYVRRWIA
ncbi:MAG: hypothetical protein EZS28_054136, partial [Streblomastix strix]